MALSTLSVWSSFAIATTRATREILPVLLTRSKGAPLRVELDFMNMGERFRAPHDVASDAERLVVPHAGHLEALTVLDSCAFPSPLLEDATMVCRRLKKLRVDRTPFSTTVLLQAPDLVELDMAFAQAADWDQLVGRSLEVLRLAEMVDVTVLPRLVERTRRLRELTYFVKDRGVDLPMANFYMELPVQCLDMLDVQLPGAGESYTMRLLIMLQSPRVIRVALAHGNPVVGFVLEYMMDGVGKPVAFAIVPSSAFELAVTDDVGRTRSLVIWCPRKATPAWLIPMMLDSTCANIRRLSFAITGPSSPRTLPSACTLSMKCASVATLTPLSQRSMQM